MAKKIKLKTRAEIRAELDAMPDANRERNRQPRITVHETTRLRVGMVIQLPAGKYRVEMVNECRARCSPLVKEKKTVIIRNKFDDDDVRQFEANVTGAAVSISPNSECPILTHPSH